MTNQRHQRVRDLFHAACDLSEMARRNFLDEACGDDSSLRADVEALLNHDGEQTDALGEANLGVGRNLLHHNFVDSPGLVSAGEDRANHAAQLSPQTSTPLDSSGHGRFLPGTMVSDRFRIVSLLGRGGMGEVYRADDLRLNQSVALKFLPSEISEDSSLIEHLRNEVKLSRQIAHPNVCRVYDIAEEDGQHFLTMEYVDGEDLKSLLRRIGRLPKDKGIDIARQLCLGLAAAHDRGILHRDLKPANVMIDGRGRLRITDFGLARLVTERNAAHDLAGTPAYMAPEQLADGQVTIKSDLYSFGLILYEVFTGRPAFNVRSISELQRAHLDEFPAMPSTLVNDIDPVVERVIMQCLNADPINRPTSARSVAAAMPGGGSLEAAIAAGQIPSPDMIAALGEGQGQSWKANAICLILVFVGMIGIAQLSRKSQATINFNSQALDQVHAARRIVEELGYGQQSYDSTWGVDWNAHFFGYFKDNPDAKALWQRLTGAPPTAATFWYRQHIKDLVPESGRKHFAAMFVTPDDPPRSSPGMIGLVVDAKGKLLEWQATPIPSVNETAVSEHDDDRGLTECRSALLHSAGVNETVFDADFDRVDSAGHIPPVFATEWEVWESALNELRVELASYQGRPVYFRIGPRPSEESREPSRLFGFTLVLTLVAIFAVAIWLTCRNWMSGRGDRRGAARMFLFVVCASFLYWLFQAHHVFGPGEMIMVMETMARAFLRAFLICAAYVGLEPYVRRLWPNTLVGWNRLMTGRLRDPIVGRAILMGIFGGVVLQLMGSIWLAFGITRQVSLAADPILDVSSGPFPLRPLLGPHVALGQICRELMISLVCGFVASLLIVYALRVVLRKDWLAYVAFVSFYSIPSLAKGDYVAACTIVMWTTTALILLFRFGVLTIVVTWITWQILAWPITFDPAAPNIDIGLMGHLLVAAVACYGLHASHAAPKTPALQFE